MTFSLNDKWLLKISFALVLDDAELKRIIFFVFMKRGYFQTQKIFLLSQPTRPKYFFEMLSIVSLLVFTLEY